MLTHRNNQDRDTGGGTSRFTWLILSFQIAITSLFLLFQWLAEVSVDRFMLNKAVGFVLGKPLQENYDMTNGSTNTTFYILSLLSLTVVAIPMLITMVYHWHFVPRHEHTHDHDIAPVYNPGLRQDLLNLRHRIGRFLHRFETPLELLGFLITFGFFDATSVYVFLLDYKNKIGTIGRSIIAAICAVTSMWGNSRFHGHYLHERFNLREMWNRMPFWKKMVALWSGIAVLVGHGFEGFADVTYFAGLFNISSDLVKSIVYSFAGIAAIFVMLVEGRTEGITMFRTFSNRINVSRTAYVVMLPAGLLHGLMSTLGILMLLDGISQLAFSESIATKIDSLFERLGLILFLYLTLGLENALGYYTSILPCADLAINDFKKFLNENETILLIRYEIGFMLSPARDKMSELLDRVLEFFRGDRTESMQWLVDIIQDLKKRLLLAGDKITCGLLRHSLFSSVSKAEEPGAFTYREGVPLTDTRGEEDPADLTGIIFQRGSR